MWPRLNDVSSTLSRRGARISRRAKPRRTARSMIPATAVQLKRSRRDTASTLASHNQPITSDSNAAVYLDRPSAHGTRVVATPCSGHCTRGTS